MKQTGQLVSDNQKKAASRTSKLVNSKNTNWINKTTKETYFGSASSLANEHLKNPSLRRSLAKVYSGEKLEHLGWQLLKITT